MRNALHEQLLKAGLIDEKRLENLEKEKSHERTKTTHHDHSAARPKKTRNRQAPQNARIENRRATSPPAPKPAVSNAEQQAARRALEREVVQLIKANRRIHNDGEEVFNFIDGQKVGRIYVTPTMQGELTRGELAIVRLRTRYAVVPTNVASLIAEKAPELVIASQPAAPEESDPAYLEHPIPDDLRW